MVIVWGTKVKEEHGGVMPVFCPSCAQVVWGDCYIIKSASHVYFIHGGFMEASRYLRCRCCGDLLNAPQQVKMYKLNDDEQVFPSQELIAKGNPQLVEKGTTQVQEVDLPTGVSRDTWAILNGLHANLETEKKNSNVSENTGGMVIMLCMAAFGTAIAIWVNYEHKSKVLPYSIWAVCIAAATFLTIKIHNWILNRAVHRVMKKQVRNFLDRHNKSINELMGDADILDQRTFKQVKKYLSHYSKKNMVR